VDDFGVEFVGIEHFNFLLDILKKYHGVQFNMAGDRYCYQMGLPKQALPHQHARVY
jgi:hypothetical protein